MVRKAVKRNHFKRMIRESFRLHQGTITGLDVVVVVYKPVNQFNTIQLRETLDQEWLRLISFYKKS
jgi:ribonuclease P protein component